MIWFYLILGFIFLCIGGATKEEGWYSLALVFFIGSLLLQIIW